MNNIIRISIPELMDGRYLFIPSYQRGYRWTAKQVTDLLKDLFSYANNGKHDLNIVNDGDYYCLQPIVAREINDSEERKDLAESYSIPADKRIWEIIDGQQRLTTTYILYLYLMKKKNITVDSLKLDSKELYNLIYATRKGSSTYLKNLDSTPSNSNDNIDFYHMQMAYDTIDNWIFSKEKFDGINANVLCSRYQQDPIPSTAIGILWDLLNRKRGYKSPYGTVQFLWYEIDGGKDVIQEFRETNMNQIHLTNAELIKALFLKTLPKVSVQELLERANLWESIENTLQDNTFWSFLIKRGFDLPNRIDLLFRLSYQIECLKKLEIEKTLKEGKKAILSDEEIKGELANCKNYLVEKDFLFNHFNNKFDGLEGDKLSNKINDEWQKILTIFHTLEDWYHDVICYNLIGMLSQFDSSELAVYYYKFISMDENDSREEFKKYLNKKLKIPFKKIKYDKDGQLILSYGNPLVFNLLLLLNVNHLNKQAEGANGVDKHGYIYKFPFDVLQHDWDIEHIDSFTTNQLKDDKVKEKWIEVAKTDLGIVDEKLSQSIKQKNWDKAISLLKSLAKEPEISDDAKNNISNLTLLDAETNRSYGNSLFVTKRKVIINRMKSGQYVPVTTSFVFMKLFDDSGVSRSIWGEDDMKKYHAYICSELVDYLPKFKKVENE